VITLNHNRSRVLSVFVVSALIAIGANAGQLHGLRILKDNCFRCHGEEKRKGGLVLNSRAAMMKGGDTGIVVNLGAPAESQLLQLLAKKADPHMPPKKQLSDEEIEAVKDWIKGGATWDQKALTEDKLSDVNFGTLAAGYQPVAAVAASEKYIAAGKGNRIDLYEPADKEPKKLIELKGHRDVVQSLAWSPDGKRLASGGFRRIVIWEIPSGKQLKVIETGLRGRVTALVFAGEGKFLTAADSLATRSGTLAVFSSDKWQAVKTIPAHSDTIYSLVASRDTKFVATASADKLAKIWRVSDWKHTGTFEGHTGYVLATDFNPKGDRIATASADAKIKVWDVKTRKQLSEFSDRSSTLAITGLFWRLNPLKDKPKDDDDWIVTTCEDGKTRLYTDLLLHEGAQRSTGAKMKSWGSIDAELNSLTYSPARKQVITGDSAGGLGVWAAKGKLEKYLK
jgi:WD40 repeat protein